MLSNCKESNTTDGCVGHKKQRVSAYMSKIKSFKNFKAD